MVQHVLVYAELDIQIEIDDYHDYEKAIAAYNEAIRCLRKKVGGEELTNIRGSSALMRRQEVINEKIDHTKRFLEIKR